MKRSRPGRSLVLLAALAALPLAGCSEASGHTQGAEPCAKTKYDAMYFAVDPSWMVVKFPQEDLETYQRRGFTLERHIDLETGGAGWRTLLLRR